MFSASYSLTLAFVLTLLAELQVGQSENVTMRVSLNNTEDGRLMASIFIGNATSKQLKNLNLILDIDAVIDNSEKLIGAKGYVRETKRNSVVEISTLYDNEKDAVIRKLRLHIEDLKKLLSYKEKEIKKLQCLNAIKAQLKRTEGYELFPGIGYYKLHETPQDYITASKICKEEGAHLAIINSDAEADILMNLIRKLSNKYKKSRRPWIGVNDPHRDKTFRTIFGMPLKDAGFSKWRPGEPSGGRNAFCVDFGSGGLGDYNCAYKDSFICELFLPWEPHFWLP